MTSAQSKYTKVFLNRPNQQNALNSHIFTTPFLLISRARKQMVLIPEIYQNADQS